MKPHITHHDDCGCLSERHRIECAALRAKLAEVTQERDDEREAMAALLDSCDPEEQAKTEAGSEATAIRINAAACVHCGAFIAQSGAGDDAVAAGFALMVEHDAQCDKHPGNARAAAIAAQLAASQAETRMLLEALADHGKHESYCILSAFRGGCLTEDGGYEIDYGGKWYPASSPPKCECGLSAALAALPASLRGKP